MNDDINYIPYYKTLNWAQTEKYIRIAAENMSDLSFLQTITVKRLGYTEWEITLDMEPFDSHYMGVFKIYADPIRDRFEITPLHENFTVWSLKTCSSYTYKAKPRDTSRKHCDYFIKRLTKHFTENRNIWKDDLVPGQVDAFGKILTDVSARSWDNLIKTK